MFNCIGEYLKSGKLIQNMKSSPRSGKIDILYPSNPGFCQA